MNAQQLRPHTIGLLVGFAAQFLIGMSLDLFVSLPDNHPGASGNDYFIRSWHSLVWSLSGKGSLALAIHVVIALALTFGTISLTTRSVHMHNQLWSWCAGLAALFTLGALFHGLSFVDYNNDVSSMLMAVSWLVAVGALLFALIMSGQNTPVSKLGKK